MGYLTTDNPPRGEICVKTPEIIEGYYKNSEETQEKFVDGYFRTGDIGIMAAPGKIRIIDRKKNLFKLAQGEFVAPERLEGMFENSSLIEQVYIYGNILQTNVLAVVVPHAEALAQWWEREGRTEEGTLTDSLVCIYVLCIYTCACMYYAGNQKTSDLNSSWILVNIMIMIKHTAYRIVSSLIVSIHLIKYVW